MKEMFIAQTGTPIVFPAVIILGALSEAVTK
jgi:hypothetical protein